MYSGTDNLKYTRGTTRIDKTSQLIVNALSSLTFNARSRITLIEYSDTHNIFSDNLLQSVPFANFH